MRRNKSIKIITVIITIIIANAPSGTKSGEAPSVVYPAYSCYLIVLWRLSEYYRGAFVESRLPILSQIRWVIKNLTVPLYKYVATCYLTYLYA